MHAPDPATLELEADATVASQAADRDSFAAKIPLGLAVDRSGSAVAVETRNASGKRSEDRHHSLRTVESSRASFGLLLGPAGAAEVNRQAPGQSLLVPSARDLLAPHTAPQRERWLGQG